jgi:serine protease Do
LLALLLGMGAASARADAPKPSSPSVIPEPPKAFFKDAPESVAELKEMQEHVRKVLDKVIPCTVGLQIGGASGSGVIIDKEGHVLTAGHVSGKPDRDCTIILHDGKRLKGKTLGGNFGVDSGLVKITDEGEWPYADMGNSADLKKAQWCI